MTTIDVTQEDIDSGIPGKCKTCPVARGVERMTGGTVEVYWERILIDDDVYDLPPAAVEFIKRFDVGDPVKPIRFELPI